MPKYHYLLYIYIGDICHRIDDLSRQYTLKSFWDNTGPHIVGVKRYRPDAKQNTNKSSRMKTIELLHVARGVLVTVVTVITVLVVVVRVVVTQL